VSLLAGSVYIFALSGGGGSVWTQTQKLLAYDGSPGSSLGVSVFLDGGLLAVGANWDNNEKGSGAGGFRRIC
jgi:hypothetical protein